MSGGNIAPVVAGLAIGIAFVVSFSVFEPKFQEYSGLDKSLAVLVVQARTSENNNNSVPDGGCLPTSLSEISEKSFPIREPRTELIAPNAELKDVDDFLEMVTLYYADFSMCPSDESLEAMIEKGAVKLTIFKPQIILKDSAEFQEQGLDYYTTNPDIVADVKPIDVNGYKGVGWGPYQSQSVVRLNGEIIESTPIPGHGVVRFYHEQDGTVYFITANKPLEEIVEIAKSIL